MKTTVWQFLLSLDPLVVGLSVLGIALIVGVLIVNTIQVNRARRSHRRGRSYLEGRTAAIPDAMRLEPTIDGGQPGSPLAADTIAVNESTRSSQAPEVEVAATPENLINSDVAREPNQKPEADLPALEVQSNESAYAYKNNATEIPTGNVLDGNARASDVSYPPLPLDARVHSVVSVGFLDPLHIEESKALTTTLATKFPNTTAWGIDAAGTEWVALSHGRHISSEGLMQQIAFAMPLATRAGAVTEKSLRDWMAVIDHAGQEAGGKIVYAPIGEDARRAVELDQFCTGIDTIAGITLLRADRSSIPGTRLRGTLEAEGFKLAPVGAFQMIADDGHTVLYEARSVRGQPMTPDSLRLDGVQGLSLVLDVMRVPNPLAQFDAMRALAKRLGTRLEASIVDDRGAALSDAAFAQTRGEIENKIRTARSAGIEPGGPSAQVLFAD